MTEKVKKTDSLFEEYCIFNQGNTFTTDIEMTSSTKSLIIWLLLKGGFKNEIKFNQSSLAKELKIQRNEIVRSIHYCLVKDILLKVGKESRDTIYVINPEFIWKGEAKDYHEQFSLFYEDARQDKSLYKKAPYEKYIYINHKSPILLKPDITSSTLTFIMWLFLECRFDNRVEIGKPIKLAERLKMTRQSLASSIKYCLDKNNGILGNLEIKKKEITCSINPEIIWKGNLINHQIVTDNFNIKN